MLAVFVLTACGSSRHSVEASDGDYTQPANTAVIRAPHAAWTGLYTSINVNIDSPMSMGCSGRLTMEKGRYIHLSLRFIGMEVAAVYIDSQSVYFVDKYHKYLFAEPLADILGERYRELTLTDIQDILLGVAEMPDNSVVQIVPSGFVGCEVGLVASHLSLNADIPQGQVRGSMSWNPVSATWNDANRKVDFKVPGNYTRITLEALLAALGNM